MRALELSTLALTVLAGGMPWLFACASAPRPPAPPAGPAASAARGTGAAAGPAGAGAHPAAAAAFPAEPDPHSFARPAEVAVEHLVLDLTVDFEARRLSGRASLRLRTKSGADTLVLDTRDLDVQRVTLGDGKTAAPFVLGEPVPHLGRSLAIRIPPGTQWVHVDYATRPEAAALQWLTPAQAGSLLPLLFTQSEAILARTWVPCQDTPAVRQTYEATVRVPPGMLALMSAENPTAIAADGVYRFRMPQPVPSYLLALAVGDLAFKPLSDRSGVYALPSMLERAAWELADTPRMMAAAEKLYGPYRWGRYDLLVLPPSYPYGGMENPRLTFATPTILAGDRSLVSLVAHELAHSWSGNLVTNASWNDLWINEGFTVYLERRIMESLYGKDYVDMLAALGRQDLDDTVREKGADNPDTRLHLDLAGRDPDDAVSDVAYEKGALLLATIEASVGRERFDRFLRGYFDAFAFQSMDTRRLVAYLKAHLLDASPGLAESLRLDEWLYGPGVPATAIAVRSAAFARVDRAVAAYAGGTPPAQLDTGGWTTHHWLRFLRNLPQLTPQQMAELDAAFHLTGTGNDEILDTWLLLAIRNAYAPADAALERFLLTVGRRKYLQPLYAELAKTPAGAETALRIYGRARPGYHPVTQATVDKILDWRG
ncbi:MAG TPA: M1 family metallopeptidase [Thermoanaerobaculia bacterium]|jgi:aminopeptidase N|nr:M1 family metallopeptidase [Thermoanaerobaculia bacterium]